MLEFKDGFIRWKVKPSSKVRVGDIAGSLRSDGYLRVLSCGERAYVHIISYEIHYGAVPEGFEVDHIDHNRINNNPSNLRAVKRSVNAKNKTRYSNNTSGITGVSLRGERFRAMCRVDGVLVSIGTFNTEHEAEKELSEFRSKNKFHKNHGV